MRMRDLVGNLRGNKVPRLWIDSSCACPASARRHPSVSRGRRVKDNKQQPLPPGHVDCLGSLNISANPSRSTSLSVWSSFSSGLLFFFSSLLSSTASPLMCVCGGGGQLGAAFIFIKAASLGKGKEKVSFRHAALALVSPSHCGRTSSRM